MKKLYSLIIGLLLILGLSSCSFFNTSTNYDDSEAEVVEVSTQISKVVNNVEESCVAVYCQNATQGSASIGSGVIFKNDKDTYYVLTNYHVIEGFVEDTQSQYFIYVGNNYTRYTASVTNYYNSQKDLAVLTFKPGKDLKTISISSNYQPIVTPGETVIAIGCPISLDYFNSVVTGVVSKSEYRATNNGGSLSVIQNTCPINPGNSGGGLFNLAGELIGINFKKTTYVYDGGEKVVVDGLNYAIALSEVILFLNTYSLI